MKKVNLIDSKEWYIQQDQAQAYLDIMKKGYGNGIISVENQLLEKNIEIISQHIQDSATYVDLGPGDGKKTLFLLDHLIPRNKIADYVAVDIQPTYLTISEIVKNTFTIPASKVCSSFETFLSHRTRPNASFLYLGATFGNFLPGTIDKKIFEYMIEEDSVYLSAALFPSNRQQIVGEYSATEQMFIPYAKRLGITKAKFHVSFNEETNAVEQGFIQDNTYFILGMSRKPSVEEFKKQISQYFQGDYFIENNHIGFIGSKKKNILKGIANENT